MFVDIDCAPNVFVTSESYSSELPIKDSNVMAFCSANRTACIIKNNFYIIVTKLITFVINLFYITVFNPKTTISVKFGNICISDKLFKFITRRALISFLPNPIILICFFQIGRMTKSVSTGIRIKIKSTVTSSFVFIFTCDFRCTFLNCITCGCCVGSYWDS